MDTFFDIKKILISVTFCEDDVLPFLSHMPWFNPIVEIKLQQVGIYIGPETPGIYFSAVTFTLTILQYVFKTILEIVLMR